MTKLEKDILKIDLDIESYDSAVEQMLERLDYLDSKEAFNIDNIERIEFIQKRNFSCRIYLKSEISETLIMVLQLLLGSDYKKETYTILRHFKFKESYSNRCYDQKQYADGEFIVGKITNEVLIVESLKLMRTKRLQFLKEMADEKHCPICKKTFNLWSFKQDELSLKEFKISGLCKFCQDDFFGESKK